MESMRESWTDERLDDLTERVGSGFERIDADLRGLRVETRSEFGALRGETRAEFMALRTEMKSGFDRVDERFDRIDERFERLDERFERLDERFERIDERFEGLHRLLVQSVVVLIAALVGLHFV